MAKEEIEKILKRLEEKLEQRIPLAADRSPETVIEELQGIRACLRPEEEDYQRIT